MGEEIGTKSVEIVKIEITTEDKTVTQDSSTTLNKEYYAEQILVIGTDQHPATDNMVRNIVISTGAMSFPVNAVMKFAMHAIRKVRLNKDQRWTIILCVGGYTEKQLKAIEDTLRSIRDDNDLASVEHILRCAKPDSILRYINEGYHKGAGVKTDREKTKIRRIGVYCHGLVFQFALWLGLWKDPHPFDVGYANNMNKDSFLEGDTIIYSFACRTGIGNPDIFHSVYYDEKVSTGIFSSKTVRRRYDLMLDKSLAQAMSNASGGITYAYLKRSSYHETFNKSDELDFMEAYQAHVSGGKPTRSSSYIETFKTNGISDADEKRYKELKEIKDRRYLVDGQTFDPQGALHPVGNATTPLGLEDGMKTFRPK